MLEVRVSHPASLIDLNKIIKSSQLCLSRALAVVVTKTCENDEVDQIDRFKFRRINEY